MYRCFKRYKRVTQNDTFHGEESVRPLRKPYATNTITRLPESETETLFCDDCDTVLSDVQYLQKHVKEWCNSRQFSYDKPPTKRRKVLKDVDDVTSDVFLDDDQSEIQSMDDDSDEEVDADSNKYV